MILFTDYFGPKIDHPDATPARCSNAEELLDRVNRLLEKAKEENAYPGQNDPDTGTQISGSRNGAGDGGFRLQSSSTGSARSSHKEGMAVDVYDPADNLERWITDAILVEFDLYREDPKATSGWVHLQTRRPGSGRRTYPI